MYRFFLKLIKSIVHHDSEYSLAKAYEDITIDTHTQCVRNTGMLYIRPLGNSGEQVVTSNPCPEKNQQSTENAWSMPVL